MKGAAALAVLLLILQSIHLGESGTYLSRDGALSVSWQFTATNITFNLTAINGTSAQIFLPIDEYRSDLIRINTVQGGLDDLATCNGSIISDSSNDYWITGFTAIDGSTFVSFTRPLDTSDPNDAIIKNYVSTYSFELEVFNVSGYLNRSLSFRDTVRINLLDSKPNEVNGSITTSLESEPIAATLSNETDVFSCVIFNRTITDDIHVIKAEAIITPGNENDVRSISLYLCDNTIDSSDNFDCFTSGREQKIQRCQKVIAVLNPLDGAFVMPPDVGLLIERSVSTRYFMQKTHYRPTSTAGKQDNSTIRLTTTTSLRVHEAGVLQLGIREGLLIPPNVNTMLASGYCSGTCLNHTTLNTSGFDIFSVALQSRRLTERMTLRHFSRSNENQDAAVVDQPFYDGLVTLYLGSPRRVMLDDVLQVVCSMNSRSRNTAAQGGLGSAAEECQAFLFYYPKTNLSQCQTEPLYTRDASDPIYSLLNTTIGSFNWSAGTNDGLGAVVWSESVISGIQNRYYNGTTLETCTGDVAFTEQWTIIELANSSLPLYKRVNGSCPETVTSTSLGTTTNGIGQSETAVTTQPNEISTTLPITTIYSQSETAVTTQPNAISTTLPITTIYSQSETAVTTQPNAISTTLPITTIYSQSETAVTTLSAAAATTQPGANTSAQSATTMFIQPGTTISNQSVTTTPVQSVTTAGNSSQSSTNSTTANTTNTAAYTNSSVSTTAASSDATGTTVNVAVTSASVSTSIADTTSTTISATASTTVTPITTAKNSARRLLESPVMTAVYNFMLLMSLKKVVSVFD